MRVPTTVELPAKVPVVEIDEEPWRRHPGPILLLAGPGTGKTHQLGFRIKDLVEKRCVDPRSITIITFTREAAENMRRRIADEEKPEVYIAPELRPERITTMHSFGLGIVRAHTAVLGLPDDFTVMTHSRLRRILFRDAALLTGNSEADGQVADQLRQKGIPPETGSAAAEITKRYELILRANRSIDYDDQIQLASKLLRMNDAFRTKYSSYASHLLVDEYQDINAGQRELISLLSGDHPEGLFVVGDDDQSVYGFRGGTPKYIREFLKEYGSGARVLNLVKSRRCPGNILKAALRIVEHFDKTRVIKPAPTFYEGKEDSGLVQVHDVATEFAEAEVVAGIARQALPKREVLILVPAKQYAEPIKRELRRKRVAYTHRPSLDDSGFVLLQTIHEWCENTSDNFALRLCIEDLIEVGAGKVPSRRSRGPELIERRKAALAEIAGLWEDVASDEATLWLALGRRATAGSLFGDIRDRLAALLEASVKKPDEFLGLVAKNLRPWTTVAELMKEIRGWLEELRTHGQSGEGAARIMTLQAAKGLEAEVVCVIGLNDEVVCRKGATQEDVEEAARLSYVSMTRAREELHLFHARKREASTTFLAKSFNLTPSRFLAAVDPDKTLSKYHQAPSKIKGKSKDRRVAPEER
jgi:DNA helicase-2/ATP-dependent DNA helicase PcrA